MLLVVCFVSCCYIVCCCVNCLILMAVLFSGVVYILWFLVALRFVVLFIFLFVLLN